MSYSRICRALLAGLAAWLAACSDFPSEPPRHLVLITLDTLRSDRLGSYGYSADTSPNLDALAERGIRFDDAVAQSIATPPSHASILTGLTPPSHGLRRLVKHELDRGNDTLAEILKDAGFSTAAFVSGLPLRQATGLDQGFDFYEDNFTVTNLVEERPAFETNDAVRSWLTAAPDERLFLWVHYFDPHSPYYPPEEYRARFGVQDQRSRWLVVGFNANPETHHPKKRERTVPPDRMAKMSNLYDSAVSYTDAAVGELLQQLEAAGILQDALVAVVADHGEMLGEYGYYFGHWDVYEETARVPMLLVHPRGHFAGKVVESLVGTIDLVPTLLTWLGVDYDGEFDGRDLTPLIQGHPGEPREIYTEQFEFFPVRAVRTDDWLLVQRAPRGARVSEGKLILYARDSGQVGELRVSNNPEVKQRLLRSLESLGSASRARDSREMTVSPEILERLRALGYTDEADGGSAHSDTEEQ
jgi:arylsulfatase A-like enzyme